MFLIQGNEQKQEPTQPWTLHVRNLTPRELGRFGQWIALARNKNWERGSEVGKKVRGRGHGFPRTDDNIHDLKEGRLPRYGSPRGWAGRLEEESSCLERIRASCVCSFPSTTSLNHVLVFRASELNSWGEFESVEMKVKQLSKQVFLTPDVKDNHFHFQENENYLAFFFLFLSLHCFKKMCHFPLTAYTSLTRTSGCLKTKWISRSQSVHLESMCLLISVINFYFPLHLFQTFLVR